MMRPAALTAAGDMFTRHVPVLRSEALGALTLKPGGIYIDGTFGAGGYSSEILASFPDIRVYAFDRDPDAIRGGQALVKASNGRLTLIEAAFSEMADHGLPPVDGVVLDIGVSSMQFDEAVRGFSFRNDGPLDMRMTQDGPSAADIVNTETEERLADIIYHYGEERLSRPLARGIVAAREEAPITTTRRLSDVITAINWPRPNEIHPATRTFQALRIAVNDELGELARALHAAERLLKPQGVLAVVTFHSLEDRIVKQFFATRSGRSGGSRFQPVVSSVQTFEIAGKWPCTPQADEIAFNSRARSAKLRAAIRTAEPAGTTDKQIMALAGLPDRRTTPRRKPSARPDKASARPQKPTRRH
jgi:16S rRNA (cytosine1402-N4)-methyltransferase